MFTDIHSHPRLLASEHYRTRETNGSIQSARPDHRTASASTPVSPTPDLTRRGAGALLSGRGA